MTLEPYICELDPETEGEIHLYLYKDVENIADLKKKLMARQLECCLIKAKLIHDPFQVAIAANKALVSMKFSNMTTHTLFSEILFNLFISNNISQSLKTFGVGLEDTCLIVALYKMKDDGISPTVILDQIKGTPCSMTSLNEFSDDEQIMKTYKIEADELKTSFLIDSIVSRIATKDTF